MGLAADRTASHSFQSVTLPPRRCNHDKLTTRRTLLACNAVFYVLRKAGFRFRSNMQINRRLSGGSDINATAGREPADHARFHWRRQSARRTCSRNREGITKNILNPL